MDGALKAVFRFGLKLDTYASAFEHPLMHEAGKLC